VAQPTEEETSRAPGQPVEGRRERDDLIEELGKARSFLRYTVKDLTDEQAASRPTASELCPAGLIKHVNAVEQSWTEFIVTGHGVGGMDAGAMEAHAAGFRMEEGETLAQLLQSYQDTADRTEELVRGLPSLDVSQPLPQAPWFPPGARWTARQVIIHIIAETAQHAGHADILRESIDGQKTMG
jgi:hypothetical protein